MVDLQDGKDNSDRPLGAVLVARGCEAAFSRYLERLHFGVQLVWSCFLEIAASNETTLPEK